MYTVGEEFRGVLSIHLESKNFLSQIKKKIRRSFEFRENVRSIFMQPLGKILNIFNTTDKNFFRLQIFAKSKDKSASIIHITFFTIKNIVFEE